MGSYSLDNMSFLMACLVTSAHRGMRSMDIFSSERN
jgi:hypothetical protein